jgi:hypothetical protein
MYCYVSEILSMLHLFSLQFRKKTIFADIYFSYILVTIFFTILFKTKEHKFKAEDFFFGV